MNYTDIQTFLAIVSSPSLSKAAESLYISQPALSHRLGALEKELGTELIARQKGVRSIELTDAGMRFIPIAKKWEQLWKETREINLECPSVPFRISNVDSLNVFLMPETAAGFLEKNPGCRLRMVTMRSNVAYEAVENREVDLGFITNPHFFKKVQTLPLFRENLVFICHMDAPYREKIFPSDLNSSDEIYIPWNNTFLMWHDYWFGSEPELKVTLDNMSLLGQLLKLKNTWAIVPATVAWTLCRKRKYRTVPMEQPPEPRTCYAILNDQHKSSSLLAEFIRELRSVADTFPEITVLSSRMFSD